MRSAALRFSKTARTTDSSADAPAAPTVDTSPSCPGRANAVKAVGGTAPPEPRNGNRCRTSTCPRTRPAAPRADSAGRQSAGTPRPSPAPRRSRMPTSTRRTGRSSTQKSSDLIRNDPAGIATIPTRTSALARSDHPVNVAPSPVSRQRRACAPLWYALLLTPRPRPSRRRPRPWARSSLRRSPSRSSRHSRSHRTSTRTRPTRRLTMRGDPCQRADEARSSQLGDSDCPDRLEPLRR